MSTRIEYVKRRGTCVSCKKRGEGADQKGLILKGQLKWVKFCLPFWSLVLAEGPC